MALRRCGGNAPSSRAVQAAASLGTWENLSKTGYRLSNGDLSFLAGMLSCAGGMSPDVVDSGLPWPVAERAVHGGSPRGAIDCAL